MATRPDFTKIWAGSRLSIPEIVSGSYAAGWDTYLGPLPPLADDHDYVMNLQDTRAAWLKDQALAAVGHEWQSDIPYSIEAYTRSQVNGKLYKSLEAANAGNEPSATPLKWRIVPDLSAAQLLDTVRIDVASASTVNLTTAAPNTRHINITGTTTINGFTAVAGVTYFVRFNAALTLTSSASLVTQTGANILTAAGDTCIIRATAANVVEVMVYVSAQGGLQDTIAFTSTGVTVWPVPEAMQTGAVKPEVTVIGGGGSGATMGAGNIATGGAGGASWKGVIDLTGITSVTITVGAGGAAVAVGGTSGNAGATSSFGALVSSAGGPGGLRDGNLPSGGSVTTSETAGISISGGRGALSVLGANGTSKYGGAGGNTLLGIGGAASVSGVAGAGYGAGGGAGGLNDSPAGQNGIVIVRW